MNKLWQDVCMCLGEGGGELGEGSVAISHQMTISKRLLLCIKITKN